MALVIAGAALAARFAYAARRPFWFDELFTLWISRRSPADLVRTLRFDSGPPLFYLLEAPLVRAGGILRTDAPARLLSLVGLAVLFFAGCRRETSGGPRFVMLLAASPLLFFYSGEARAYALLAALSFLLFLAVFRMRNRRAGALFAGASALLLPWIHYLGVLVVAGSVLLAAARKRTRPALLQVAAVVPFLAWLPVALRQPAAAISWSGESLSSSIAGALSVFGFWMRVPPYFSAFRTPAPVVGTILGALLLVLTARASRDRPVRDALLFTALPLLFAAVAGLWRPVWFAGRTEMAVLPVGLWAFARAARRSRLLGILTVVAAAAGAVLVVATLLAPPPRPPYSVTAGFVSRTAGPRDVVVASDSDYLPLRLAADRGRLAAPLLGIPAAIERHPGWFKPGKLAEKTAEVARLDGFLAGLPSGGRVYFAIPPDPAARALVTPFLSGSRVKIATPPGGDAVAIAVR